MKYSGALKIRLRSSPIKWMMKIQSNYKMKLSKSPRSRITGQVGKIRDMKRESIWKAHIGLVRHLRNRELWGRK